MSQRLFIYTSNLNRNLFSQLLCKKFKFEKQTMSTHIPRRALLYVPGDNEKHIEKVLKLPAIDCVAFDCEDGVAMNRKETARKMIRNLFENRMDFEKINKNVDWAVRINSVNSGHLLEDLEVIYGNNSEGKFPKTILLPKVECLDDLDRFSNCLQKVLDKSSKPFEKINLIFYAESCKSVMHLKEICRHAVMLSENGSDFRPVGIVFGSDDFLASLGATRDVKDSTNILYARQKVVLIAKAFDLQAIDMVYIDFKDIEGLKLQSIEGASLGYTGKQVIHPLQVPIVQEAFLPTKEKIKWAEECLDAYKEHQKVGKGAFVFRNQMIDNPTVEQAINILKLLKNDSNSQS